MVCLMRLAPADLERSTTIGLLSGVPALTTRKHHACEQYEIWLELQSEPPKKLKYLDQKTDSILLHLIQVPLE
jgi:hypothetical protein